MIKKITAIFVSFIALFTFASPAVAHIIVYPHQAGVASVQDFTVNVPNERDNPVVSVRLQIPNGVSSVIPYVTTGWTITTKTSGSGDNSTVTEIDWNGGSIPVAQAQELVFQAQVPGSSTTLAWKAYQTYSDGTVVSWDVNPAKMKNLSDAQQDALADKENKGEYSTTQVINDLTGSNSNASANNTNNGNLTNQVQIATILAGISTILSASGVGISLRKK